MYESHDSDKNIWLMASGPADDATPVAEEVMRTHLQPVVRVRERKVCAAGAPEVKTSAQNDKTSDITLKARGP